MPNKMPLKNFLAENKVGFLKLEAGKDYKISFPKTFHFIDYVDRLGKMGLAIKSHVHVLSVMRSNKRKKTSKG